MEKSKNATTAFYGLLLFVWLICIVLFNLFHQYSFYHTGWENMISASFWGYIFSLLWPLALSLYAGALYQETKTFLFDMALGLGTIWSIYCTVCAVYEKTLVSSFFVLICSSLLFVVAISLLLLGKYVNKGYQNQFSQPLVLFAAVPEKSKKWKLFYSLLPFVSLVGLFLIFPVLIETLVSVKAVASL